MMSLLVENCFVLSLQEGTFLRRLATGHTSLRIAWEIREFIPMTIGIQAEVERWGVVASSVLVESVVVLQAKFGNGEAIYRQVRGE